MKQSPELRYEDSPRYDTAPIAGVIILLVFVDLLLAFLIPETFWIMVGTAVFELLLFYFIIPRKYQILDDRVRILLGSPIKYDIPLSTIKEARPAGGAEAWVYFGLRLATSGKGVIELIRRGGMDVVFSPRDRQTFLEQLELAMRSASRRHDLSPK
ncbi:PH domain-containing protein [Dehalogenimonas formicexedens]|uniref:PH domain-containing protein n=1 Tax=Dehalogenimonas formicexedens TaxID=1839801 RepID=A0A1P8F4L1_9CHLR|nr:PH domain-containing protein [Dehalogenimonas formicexedens]APV43417.1 PH domain-containing protein [Dehalogenimonas formicexedens]